MPANSMWTEQQMPDSEWASCVFMWGSVHWLTTKLSSWMRNQQWLPSESCLQQIQVCRPMSWNMWCWCPVWSYQPQSYMQLSIRLHRRSFHKMLPSTTTSSTTSSTQTSWPLCTFALRAQCGLPPCRRPTCLFMFAKLYWITAKLPPRVHCEHWVWPNKSLHHQQV